MKTYNQLAGSNTRRIEALADGVFSIAMTLLIFDLKVPATELVHSEAELWQQFAALAPKFLTYFLGFTTLGIFWVGHHTQFQFIERSDRQMTWISVFFLMFVSLLPFSTSFLGAYLDYRLSILLYWLNILLPGVLLFCHWDYAVRQGFVADETAVRPLKQRIIWAQILYAFGALLCLVANWVSIAFIIAVQLNYALGLSARLSKS